MTPKPVEVEVRRQKAESRKMSTSTADAQAKGVTITEEALTVCLADGEQIGYRLSGSRGLSMQLRLSGRIGA